MHRTLHVSLEACERNGMKSSFVQSQVTLSTFWYCIMPNEAFSGLGKMKLRFFNLNWFLFTDNTKSPHFNSHLFEGDVVKLTERQRLNNLVFGDPDGSPSRAANNDDKIKWPNAVIPYEFDCSVGKSFNNFRLPLFWAGKGGGGGVAILPPWKLKISKVAVV